jgi:Circadian oscillating protein COP23
MNTLKSKIRLMGLIFTVGSILGLPTILVAAPAQSLPKTTFACVKKGSDYATVARRGERTTSPMIAWKDKTWGKYTPEKRCQIVSQRLTKAVAASGKLSNLDMTHGTVNSTPVICYITSKTDKCNSENILFSLKPGDVGKEKEIVSKLLNFSTLGSGDILTRGGNKPTNINQDAIPQTYGDAIEQALTPASPTTPIGQE